MFVFATCNNVFLAFFTFCTTFQNKTTTKIRTLSIGNWYPSRVDPQFPRGGTNSKGNNLIRPNFLKNRMKFKKIRPKGSPKFCFVDPPVPFTTFTYHKCWIFIRSFWSCRFSLHATTRSRRLTPASTGWLDVFSSITPSLPDHPLDADCKSASRLAWTLKVVFLLTYVNNYPHDIRYQIFIIRRPHLVIA